MNHRNNPSLSWYLLLVWKGILLFLTGILRRIAHFPLWLTGRDGAVFLSVFALVIVIGSLFILQSLFGPGDEPDPLAQTGETGRVLVQPNPVMARIGPETLRLNDVLEYARQDGKLQPEDRLSALEALERGLADDAVDQTLLARAGADAGVMSDPEVRAKLTAARNRILAAAYLEERMTEEVTSDAARELYQAQRRNMANSEEVRLRELIVGSADLAQTIFQAVSAGGSFPDLIALHSIAPSTSNGGDLGYIATDRLPDEYAARVGGLSAGLYTVPFQTEAGWTILKVEGRQRITPPPFSALETELLEFLRLRTIDAEIETLRSGSNVEIVDPEDLPPEPQPPVPSLAPGRDNPALRN